MKHKRAPKLEDLLGLIYSIAQTFLLKYPYLSLELDDYIGEAALVYFNKRWQHDPSKSKFTTYFYQCVWFHYMDITRKERNPDTRDILFSECSKMVATMSEENTFAFLRGLDPQAEEFLQVALHSSLLYPGDLCFKPYRYLIGQVLGYSEKETELISGRIMGAIIKQKDLA